MPERHRIEKEAACGSCKATGLYIGMAEREGAAVVCHSCKGTGHIIAVLEWEDFEGRKSRHGIKRVFQTNPGIVLGGPNLSQFGGIPYAEWKEGASFGERGTENRNFTCPAWWYQSADYKRKPEWDECIGIGSFSSCPSFKNKAACWARFDREKR